MKHHLPNVTLLGIDCVNLERLKIAADICQRDFMFRDIKLLSSITDQDERVVSIPAITSIEAYSQFCIKQLNSFVDTDFVLLIQYDGFILNPSAWKDEFLNYDYLGAPWWYDDNHNVDNGGFSLRSKKILELLSDDPTIVEFHPEDHHICRTYGDYLTSKGIKFAPEEVARSFAIEGGLDTPDIPKKYGDVWTNEFGFHGLQRTDISKWLSKNPEYALRNGAIIKVKNA